MGCGSSSIVPERGHTPPVATDSQLHTTSFTYSGQTLTTFRPCSDRGKLICNAGSSSCIITSKEAYGHVHLNLSKIQHNLFNSVKLYKESELKHPDVSGFTGKLVALCAEQAKRDVPDYALKLWYQNTPSDFEDEVKSIWRAKHKGVDTGIITLGDLGAGLVKGSDADAVAFQILMNANPFEIHIGKSKFALQDLRGMFFKRCDNDLTLGISNYHDFRNTIFKELHTFQRGMFIHGDIQPSNILCCENKYRFTDFGKTTSAQLFKDTYTTIPTGTEPLHIKLDGTPSYTYYLSTCSNGVMVPWKSDYKRMDFQKHLLTYHEKTKLKEKYIEEYLGNITPAVISNEPVNILKVDEVALGFTIMELFLRAKITHDNNETLETIQNDINLLVFSKTLAIPELVSTLVKSPSGLSGFSESTQVTSFHGGKSYEKRKKSELVEAAQKRRLKVPKHATKADIIALLRGQQQRRKA